MVLFFGCHQRAVDPESSCCLSMTGEDTGLEALASPLAGYLGKVQERAASLESCPWCTSKGLIYALHSYRINPQESITLCTNPQCLFPLVTRPLEDVLASLVPVVPGVGNKRKLDSELEKEEMIKSPLKRLRSTEGGDLWAKRDTDPPVMPPEPGSVSPVTNGVNSTLKTEDGKVNGFHRDFWDAETAGLQDKGVFPGCAAVPDEPATSAVSPQCSSDVLNSNGTDSAPSLHLCASETDFKHQNVPVLNGYSRLGYSPENSTTNKETTAEEELVEDFSSSAEAKCIISEDTDFPCTSLERPEKLVSVPTRLLWRNSNNLCWLDSLLAALVNCKNLRKCEPEDQPRCSSVWQLISRYEEICAAVRLHQQTGSDGVVRAPRPMLQKANIDLLSLRMSVFKLLQPKLQCKLGEMETPVFAMPLLLALDSQVEQLFQSTFQWEFRCSGCKVITKERVIKTLPTFTNIVPDWRPLNAAHLSPCNMCGMKNQRRTMLLESLSPVFMLHFVEGLPDCDVSLFTFALKRKLYSISTIIQYDHQLKHFVTWVRNDDGSWLEYDDIKHPEFKIHQKLQVPAHEIHVVFWEVEEDATPPPSSPEKEGGLSYMMVDGASDQTPDQSFPVLHDDTDIICALTEEDGSNMTDCAATADVNVSIGDSTLLSTFEGLSHNDIITLTLVNVDPADSKVKLLNENHRAKYTDPPTKTEGPDPSPDSSMSAADGDVCLKEVVEPPAALESPKTESVDSSSTNAPLAPGAKRQRGKGTSQEKGVRRRGGKAAALQSSSDLPEEFSHTPVEVTPQASPGSSTDSSSLFTSQKSLLDRNAQLSFLLSKLPANHYRQYLTKPTPTQIPPPVPEVKPSHPVHSTPNPIKRQRISAGLPTLQLVAEEGLGLPPKAAEMYCGFGLKSSTNYSELPSPLLSNGYPKRSEAPTSNQPMPGMMPSVTEVFSSKKQGSYSSNVPPGLNQTEILRYKLLKKLKAKKKKLAKLNQLLGNQEGAGLRPDSTALTSPSTVTSSTYDDDFLSDLLSPATTASNFSPDSTGFLEMMPNGQDGTNHVNSMVSQNSCCGNGLEHENFLEDFLMQCGLEAN
uniref:Ubiquitin specific peptidase like 1 n=4 Tax=Nothobranchius rachovii TaxID=451742 RepID=A0A1A8R6D2_9TELE